MASPASLWWPTRPDLGIYYGLEDRRDRPVPNQRKYHVYYVDDIVLRPLDPRAGRRHHL